MDDDNRGIFLVGPGDLQWAALRRMVRSIPGLVVAGTARSGLEAAQTIAVDPVDFVVVDVAVSKRSMPALVSSAASGEGLGAVLVLATVYGKNEIQQLLAGGVRGCLCWQDLSRDSLEQHLASVAAGGLVLSRAAAEALRRGLVRAPPSSGNALALPLQEQNLLSDLAAGLSPEQIARARGPGLRTVRRRVAALRLELGAPSQFLLGARAAQLGLITTGPGTIVPPD